MITVNTAEYLINEPAYIIAKRLNERTAKKNLLQFTQTSSWVIFAERPMIGKKTPTGATICRYRHRLEMLFPKIFADWQLIDCQGKTKLLINYKPALITSFFAVIFLLPNLLTIVMGILNGEHSGLISSAAYFVGLSAVGYLLVKREIRQTEELLLSIAENQPADMPLHMA